jgi:ABC-2 type transport system permease protein
MRAVLTILAKDLRLRLRDRSAFMIGVVTPLGLALVLHLIVGGMDDFSARYGIVDEDRGQVAEAFVDATGDLGDDIDVTTDLSASEARDQVEDGELDAVFVIPAGFSDQVLAQDEARLDVIGNVDSDIAVQVAKGIADRFASQIDAVRLSLATIGAQPTGGSITGPPSNGSVDPALVTAAQEQAAPVEIVTSKADERQLDPTTYQVAGLGALFAFFTVQYGVLGLLEERENGTMARLLSAPIPRLAIPVAKAAVSAVVGVLALTVLALASTLIMGADWGDPPVVAVMIVAMVLAAVSITGLVAGVARTAEQAGSAQTVVALVLGLLGGAFFPLSEGGGFLAELVVITPHHWFLEGLGEGRVGGLADALPAVGVLLLFAVVVGGAGATLLHVRGQR